MIKYLLLAAVCVGVFTFMHNGNAKGLVSYEQLNQELDAKTIVLVDVRTADEYRQGHIPGAILMPYDETEKLAPTLLPDKEANIVVYCRSGRRSAIAAEALQKLGYTKIRDFGGVNRWQGELKKQSI